MTFLVTADLIKRFWSHVLIRGENDCWPWQGYASKGYGYFRVTTNVMLAHRVSFFIKHGFLPKGRKKIIGHDCEFSLCVNPKHLICMTQKRNVNYPKRLQRASGWKHTAAAKTLIGQALLGNKHGQKFNTDLICKIYHAKGTHTSIAKQFKCSRAYVSLLKAGKRNSDITGHT